jgi:hypothetical protein
MLTGRILFFGRFCEGFRTPAATNISPRAAAGVRKPPRDETAGGGGEVPRAGYGDLAVSGPQPRSTARLAGRAVMASQLRGGSAFGFLDQRVACDRGPALITIRWSSCSKLTLKYLSSANFSAAAPNRRKWQMVRLDGIWNDNEHSSRLARKRLPNVLAALFQYRDAGPLVGLLRDLRQQSRKPGAADLFSRQGWSSDSPAKQRWRAIERPQAALLPLNLKDLVQAWERLPGILKRWCCPMLRRRVRAAAKHRHDDDVRQSASVAGSPLLQSWLERGRYAL